MGGEWFRYCITRVPPLVVSFLLAHLQLKLLLRKAVALEAQACGVIPVRCFIALAAQVALVVRDRAFVPRGVEAKPRKQREAAFRGHKEASRARVQPAQARA